MTYIKWPCVFRDKFIRESINPALAKLAPKVPFAAFQRAFREEHCSQLDPYGTGSCPYKREDCALAYFKVARDTLETPGVRSPVAYFRRIARSYGAKRADEKPLARGTIRTNGQAASDSGRVGSGGEEGSKLRTSRPRSIGEMFGDHDL